MSSPALAGERSIVWAFRRVNTKTPRIWWCGSSNMASVALGYWVKFCPDSLKTAGPR
jgi:hypothetical protein